MYEQTPVRKRNKRKKQPKGVKLAGNNPWQNVQPKSNGFNFPGAII